MHVSLLGSEEDNFVIGAFPLDLEVIHPLRRQLREVDFAFQPSTVAAAQEFLRQVAAKRGLQGQEAVFIGVHVRRTDYSVWLERKLKGQLVR